MGGFHADRFLCTLFICPPTGEEKCRSREKRACLAKEVEPVFTCPGRVVVDDVESSPVVALWVPESEHVVVVGSVEVLRSVEPALDDHGLGIFALRVVAKYLQVKQRLDLSCAVLAAIVCGKGVKSRNVPPPPPTHTHTRKKETTSLVEPTIRMIRDEIVEIFFPPKPIQRIVERRIWIRPKTQLVRKDHGSPNKTIFSCAKRGQSGNLCPLNASHKRFIWQIQICASLVAAPGEPNET